MGAVQQQFAVVEVLLIFRHDCFYDQSRNLDVFAVGFEVELSQCYVARVQGHIAGWRVSGLGHSQGAGIDVGAIACFRLNES